MFGGFQMVRSLLDRWTLVSRRGSGHMDLGVQKGFWTNGPWCPEGVLDRWTLVSSRVSGRMDLRVKKGFWMGNFILLLVCWKSH